MTRLLILTLCLPCAFAAPITTSWFNDLSGQYARVYPTTENEVAGVATTTWDHPTGNDQLMPTYSGVSEISTTATSLYIRTSGLGYHIMGPWHGGTGNLFANYPSNIAETASFPLIPAVADLPKTQTPGGAIGYFVDGVAMFDSRDAFSYIFSTQSDAGPSTAPARGDGNWNRDAFVNESVTFDPAFAHPAGDTLHYHAQPIGLRYLLGDSVSYDATANRYTEAPNGTHSPILAWTFDGYPLYGPYGYSDPLDPASGVRRMISGYQFRDGSNGSVNLSATGRITLPEWVTRNESQRTNPTRTNPLATNQHGPDVDSTSGPEIFVLGHYLEDYAYKGDLGLTLGTDFDLNEYNVRWCVTPEFPTGTWAYFSCIATDGTPVFPYNIARYYFGTVQGENGATLPADREIIFEGGPKISQTVENLAVDNASGEVILTWSGAEGGTYRIDRSPDLVTWSLLNDSAQPDAGPFATTADPGRANTDQRHFYRSSLTSLAEFDDTGFDYTAPVTPTFSATFAPLPNLGDITSVTVGGVAATVIGRDRNSLLLAFDDSTLAPGDYAAIITTANGTATSTDTYEVTPPRNILLLILDDWGIDSSPLDNDSASNPGTSFPAMPNLEALAARGLHFTNAYAQPVCSPTRASIITGRYGFRNGVGHPTGAGTLPASELTLPEIFTAQNSSYQLGSFGKWHLGGGETGPADLGGWTEFRGILNGGVQNYYDWEKTINGVTATDHVTTYTSTDQVNDALTFIAAQGANPWFVWMGFNAPHAPFHNPPAALHSYPAFPENAEGEVTGANRRGAYEAALQALDAEIGRLLATVDPLTTDIILIGDNGTPGQVIQAPFDGNHSKDTLFEGGVHVPLVIAGPSVTVQGTSSRLVHCVDLFSTILDLAGIDVPTATAAVDTIDSQSLTSVLTGRDSAERFIVSERHGSTIGFNGRTIRSAAHPDYKLIIFGDPTSAADTSTFELYHIASDENEQSPLTLPPALGEAHYAAYQALIAKDTELGPNQVPVTLFLRLEALTGADSPPNNDNIIPDTVTIDGVSATFVSRVDSSETTQRYWVKCTLPAEAAPYTTAVVDFPDNITANGTVHPRVFTAEEIVIGQ